MPRRGERVARISPLEEEEERVARLEKGGGSYLAIPTVERVCIS
jgi:hypothetical protein